MSHARARRARRYRRHRSCAGSRRAASTPRPVSGERLEAAAVRFGVDELDPREVTVDEIDRAGLSRPWYLITRDDTRHGGLYGRPLVRVEEGLFAHHDGLLRCGKGVCAQVLKRRRGHLVHFRDWLMATATMMMIPRAISCWLYSRPIRRSPLLITPIISDPTMEPTTDPVPPNRLVPPRALSRER